MMRTMFIALLLLILGGCSNKESGGQDGAVAELCAELDADRVILESAQGNGSSSGSSVNGVLRNETAIRLRLAVNLSRPLYLRNGGRGQNMVAFQVRLDGGRYIKEDHLEYIVLDPSQRTPVTFMAFCADFERENPTDAEQFSRAELPASLSSVSNSILRYLGDHPSANLTVVAQVAIWMAQGEAPETIQERFPFTSEDQILAQKLVQGAF